MEIYEYTPLIENNNNESISCLKSFKKEYIKRFRKSYNKQSRLMLGYTIYMTGLTPDELYYYFFGVYPIEL
jgi:hypothetical protein